MRELAKNTFDKKVKLIYEYNRNSPLFVKVANSEIEENNIDNAVEILLSGLKTYPDHPVAHMLLGKAFALMGDYNGALKWLNKGSALINSDETYDYYLNELETIKKQRSLFKVTNSKAFFNSSMVTSNLKSEPDLFNAEDKNDDETEKGTTIDERLSQLADEISKAKISSGHSTFETNSDFESILNEDNHIVSETLAKIYVAQNEFDEAIKVYEKLIEKKPGEELHYTDKINEIKSKINS